MGFLIVTIALVTVWAYKTGRPMKLVLTPEEAKAVKATWWFSARNELKIWAIFFVLGYALAGQPLAAAHWHWPIYAMIVLGSLQLFSRLAIWGTFLLWVVALVVSFIAELLGHHRLFDPLYVMVPLMGAIMAVLARFFFMFWKPRPAGSKPPWLHNPFVPPKKDRVYDSETDTYVYANGFRQPAYIRYPRDEDRPENVRRRRDEDDYFERKRADDYYFDQLRRRRE